MSVWLLIETMVGRVKMRGTLIVVLGLVAVVAFAEPPFWNVYRETYSLKEGFPNLKAGCLNCHTAVPKRNPFGQTVEAALKAEQTRTLTAEILKRLDGEDADGDGWPNREEIEQGFLPGDAGSHPEGEPPLKVSPVSVPSTVEPKIDLSIPTHRFHPLVVHFPIALFLFGAFLDLLGFRRGDDGLRRLALWNLGFGAVVSLVAVTTGIAAMLALQKPLEGVMLAHAIFGVATSALMLSTFMYRRKQEAPMGAGYWVLLATASLATLVVGHLGATLVFGG